MQIEFAQKTVVSSNLPAGQRVAFGAEVNGFMYDLLSKGLYSKPIEAVLRELSTNAADAHAMAGRGDLPFEVKLPNELDMSFHVKDFGPGLSKEQIETVYNVYLKSTKRDSNLANGCLGLGSKSPFAYTDTYMVVSAHGGVQRTYIVAKDDNGEPYSVLSAETPASAEWPSGLMVTFPVQPKDFAEFRAAAERLYRWFSVPPHVVGATLDLTPPQAIYRGALAELVPSLPNGSVVVMANVAYPLDTAVLHKEMPDLWEPLSQACGQGSWVFRVPTGAVNFPPSREALRYNERTVAFLKDMLRAVTEEVVRYIVARINSESWVFAQFAVAGELKRLFGSALFDRARPRLAESIFNGSAIFSNPVKLLQGWKLVRWEVDCVRLKCKASRPVPASEDLRINLSRPYEFFVVENPKQRQLLEAHLLVKGSCRREVYVFERTASQSCTPVPALQNAVKQALHGLEAQASEAVATEDLRETLQARRAAMKRPPKDFTVGQTLVELMPFDGEGRAAEVGLYKEQDIRTPIQLRDGVRYVVKALRQGGRSYLASCFTSDNGENETFLGTRITLREVIRALNGVQQFRRRFAGEPPVIEGFLVVSTKQAFKKALAAGLVPLSEGWRELAFTADEASEMLADFDDAVDQEQFRANVARAVANATAPVKAVLDHLGKGGVFAPRIRAHITEDEAEVVNVAVDVGAGQNERSNDEPHREESLAHWVGVLAGIGRLDETLQRAAEAITSPAKRSLRGDALSCVLRFRSAMATMFAVGYLDRLIAAGRWETLHRHYDEWSAFEAEKAAQQTSAAAG